jgi:hypothetical protein
MQNTYAACPNCSQFAAEKIKFTWWGGILGPRLLNHVKCGGCGNKYNGKSGKDNTTGIVIYSAVIAVLVFALAAAMFSALGLLVFATR